MTCCLHRYPATLTVRNRGAPLRFHGPSPRRPERHVEETPCPWTGRWTSPSVGTRRRPSTARTASPATTPPDRGSLPVTSGGDGVGRVIGQQAPDPPRRPRRQHPALQSRHPVVLAWATLTAVRVGGLRPAGSNPRALRRHGRGRLGHRDPQDPGRVGITSTPSASTWSSSIRREVDRLYNLEFAFPRAPTPDWRSGRTAARTRATSPRGGHRGGGTG